VCGAKQGKIDTRRLAMSAIYAMNDVRKHTDSKGRVNMLKRRVGLKMAVGPREPQMSHP
jgi:hypothetical protein